jgi:hypothetical protein
METYITNLLNFIGLYKFYVKLDFHKFIQKSYEFDVMVNMKKIICIQHLKYSNK